MKFRVSAEDAALNWEVKVRREGSLSPVLFGPSCSPFPLRTFKIWRCFPFCVLWYWSQWSSSWRMRSTWGLMLKGGLRVEKNRWKKTVRLGLISVSKLFWSFGWAALMFRSEKRNVPREPKSTFRIWASRELDFYVGFVGRNCARLHFRDLFEDNWIWQVRAEVTSFFLPTRQRGDFMGVIPVTFPIQSC